MNAVASRRDGAFRRFAWRLETPAGLIAMFAVAFILRLLVAPHAGVYGDLRLYQRWADRLADVGPRHFYAEGQFADYPPGYLYVLWLIGKLSATPGYLLLKLPAILADLGLAWIARHIRRTPGPAPRSRSACRCERSSPPQCSSTRPSSRSAPSGVRSDAVPAMFVLSVAPPPLHRAAVAAVGSSRRFCCSRVAIAMKPQSGFVLPVMLYALYRRYLHAAPRHRSRSTGLLSIALMPACSRSASGPSRASRSASAPSRSFTSTATRPRSTRSPAPTPSTSGACSGFWRNDSAGDHVMRWRASPRCDFGMLLFLVARRASSSGETHRAIERGANEARLLTVAAAAAALLAFTSCSRVCTSATCSSRSPSSRRSCSSARSRLAYAGLSALFLLNLWYPYAYFNSQWRTQAPASSDFHVQPWFDWLFGGFATDTVAEEGLVARRHRDRTRRRSGEASRWVSRGREPAGRASPACARERAPALDAGASRRGLQRAPRRHPRARTSAAAAEAIRGRSRWWPLVARRPGLPLRPDRLARRDDARR